MDDLFLLGRLIFGGFFLYNGANHFLMNATMVQYAAAKAVPMPEVAVAVAGVLIAALPGVEGIWQGHLSLAAPDANTARDQIANLEDTADCKGNWIKASVAPDGKFTITNGPNGFSKTHVARGSGS